MYAFHAGAGADTDADVVLIGDVRFVKRSRRYRNTNYWRRDFCIKHLDQNERLDDFGSRTRPQFIFLTVI